MKHVALQVTCGVEQTGVLLYTHQELETLKPLLCSPDVQLWLEGLCLQQLGLFVNSFQDLAPGIRHHGSYGWVTRLHDNVHAIYCVPSTVMVHTWCTIYLGSLKCLYRVCQRPTGPAVQ